MKKTSKKVIAVTLSASMLLGGSMTAMAATTTRISASVRLTIRPRLKTSQHRAWS